MTRYRLITFDITNTVLQFKVDIGIQYSSVMKLFGVNCDSSVVASAFKRLYKLQSIDHPNFGWHSKMSAKQWWHEIVCNIVRSSSSAAVDNDTLNKISRHLYALYGSKDAWILTPDSESILQKLENAGICLGVISNFDERLSTILHELQIIQHFKFVLSSYQSGCAKPHPDIFKLAEAKANVKNLQKSEIVHIGDNVELDYNAAKNVGWNALLFIGSNPLNDKTLPIYKNNAAFRSFTDMLKYILK